MDQRGGRHDDGAAVEPGPHVEPFGTHQASAGATPWHLERASGTAAQLHAASPDPTRRSVRVHEVTADAVVLGSTQPDDVVDEQAASAAGLQIARRRSGGGAVLLRPGSHVWLDVTVPVGDPLWDDDVERSSWWLGERWAAAVARTAPRADAKVHRVGVDDRELARLACFAATGPGEVLVDGRKVVGISQRRTREGARFQCVAYLEWEPDVLLGVLRAGPLAARVADALHRGADAWPAPVEPGGALADDPTTAWRLVEELVALLP